MFWLNAFPIANWIYVKDIGNLVISKKGKRKEYANVENHIGEMLENWKLTRNTEIKEE